MSDTLQQRYYKINQFHLSLMGLWPWQSRRQRFLRITLAVLLAVVLGPPQIIATVESRDDPEMFAECTMPIISLLFFYIRLVTMIMTSDETLEIWQRIEMDWKSLDQHPEMHILHNYAARGRQFTITYSVAVYFTMTLYGTRPIVPRILELMKLTNETLPKTLMFPVNYYGLDLDTYYCYILTTEYIGTMVLCILIIATDTMFVVEVQHACGMFAVVGYVREELTSILGLAMFILLSFIRAFSHQLQRIANDETEKFANHSHPKLDPTFQNLIVCIRKHRDVIEFGEIIAATLTWPLFAGVAVVMLTISYGSLQTVLLMNINPKWAARYVAYEIVLIIGLFFYCFFSQRLLDHSQQIGEYICQTEWYKTSLSTQKLLNLITMRTYFPCHLTAGKLIVMSLENYVTILKTSVSYFAVMRSIQ